jgi:hypothetical protein
MISERMLKRYAIVRIFLVCAGIFLLFWWPLSHWFLSDWYHGLLGFAPGSYPDGMVKIIGTCGVVPVVIMFLCAKDPARNRSYVILLMVFALLISATYLYLIARGDFPVRELLNVGLSICLFLFLMIFYPWRSEQ